MTSERGHRIVAHTADVILEAWGPDLPSCCEEAVAALVETYADPSRAAVVDRHHAHVATGPSASMLLEVLEEVIFTLDTAEAVPVVAAIDISQDGGLDVDLLLADRASIEPTGAVPKAVSHSELTVDTARDGVRCRFLVDV